MIIKILETRYEDSMLNLEKFPKENNILFITGISGSGKTFTSKIYAKKYNAEIIHLDDIDYLYGVDDKGETQNIKFKKQILNKFPLSSAPDDDTFDKYMQDVIKYLVILLENDFNNNYIIEGLQLSEYFIDNVDYFKNKSIIIKNTSINQSIKQKQQREGDDDNIEFNKFEKRSFSRLQKFKKQLIQREIKKYESLRT